jgi:O-antigen ligase
MPSPRRLPALVTAQGALLIGMTVLLIQPKGVPDLFGVGAPLSWTAICVIAALPTLVASTLKAGMPKTRLDPFLWAYVACFLVVFPFSQGRATSALWLMSLLANVLVFYAAAAIARDAEPLIGVVWLTIVLGVAVLQIMAIDFHLEQGLLTRITDYDRPEGWSGYPELGFLVCIQMAILIALLQTTRGWWRRAAIGLVIAVGVVELIFLFSRMAWVTAAALLVVSVMAGRPIGRMWKPAVGAVALLAVVGVMIAQSGTGRRLLVSLTGPTASASRLDIWQRTTAMIEDHPVFGVGAGNFQAIFEPVYNPMLNNDLRRGGHAHNLWLQEAAELGLIAAIAYAVFWVASLVIGAPLSSGSWIERASFLIIVAIAVRSMGDYMFFSTGGAQARLHTLLWLAWGVVGGRSAVRPAPAAVPAANLEAVQA